MSHDPKDRGHPWGVHWRTEKSSSHHWWLIMIMIGMGLLLIGVRVTSGLF